MIIVKKFEVKNGKRLAVYLVFATNMPVRKAWKELHKIPKEYKKRWAIETGYRTVNETRARTKSNSLSARLFLFYFTMTALNVLAMCNHDADTARTRAGLLERARKRKGQAGRRAGKGARRGRKEAVAARLAQRRDQGRHVRLDAHDRRRNVPAQRRGPRRSARAPGEPRMTRGGSAQQPPPLHWQPEKPNPCPRCRAAARPAAKNPPKPHMPALFARRGLEITRNARVFGGMPRPARP